MAPRKLPTGSSLAVDIHRTLAGAGRLINKFGRNTDVGTGAEEDICETGGSIVYAQDEHIPTIGSSGNDTAAGTHAQAITMIGVNKACSEITETVTLGDTPTKAFFRVDRVYVSRVGTYGNTNENAITVALNGNTQVTIAAGMGQSLRTNYTVPRGYCAYVFNYRVAIESSKSVNLRLLIRRNPDEFETPTAWRALHTSLGSTGVFTHDFQGGVVIPGPCDVRWVGQGVAAASEVHIDYLMALVPDGA